MQLQIKIYLAISPTALYGGKIIQMHHRGTILFLKTNLLKSEVSTQTQMVNSFVTKIDNKSTNLTNPCTYMTTQESLDKV